MRAAIYLRQSKDKTGEELAVDRQRNDARDLARIRGWDVALEAMDNDTSAAGGKDRPGFESVLEAVESGEVGVIVAWDMTRLTRNRRDWVRVVEMGQRHKTVLAFCRGSDLDLSMPNNRMVADILASVARQEIEQKSDRQRSSNLHAAMKGRRVGGRRPFGYDRTGMIIEDREATAIRQAYDDILAGVKLAQIAKAWNDAGLVPPQKARNGEPGHWRSTTVRYVLTNPRNAGKRGYGAVPEHGRRKIEIVGDAKWPAIVSEETWRAVQGVLDDPSRKTTAGRRGRCLLTGIALCGVCGATVNAGRSNPHQGPIYRCSATNGHVARSAPPVEAWVTEVVLARLERPDAAELLRDDNREDIGALRSEASALRVRLDQLAASFADGDLTSSQLKTGTERIKSKLADVEARMADAGRTDVLGPLLAADDLRAAWQALGTDRQRAVIDALMIIRIMPPGRGVRTFRPETVVIEPRR